VNFSRIAVAADRKVKLPHQLQLLLPPPTLQFPFPLACVPLILKSLLPNQANRSALRSKCRPNAPVVFLNSLADVRRHSNIERPIRASHQVTEPSPHNFFGHENLAESETLFYFLMPGVLSARIAEFRRFQPLGVLPPVLGRRVVPVLTIVAL
jgi:hypothetical protein